MHAAVMVDTTIGISCARKAPALSDKGVTMARRMIVLMLTMLMVFAIAAPSAFGWANGADLDGDGLGDNGYGTHDWILDNAITLAANADPQGTAWLAAEKQTALFATDDPDTQRNPDVTLHLFREIGIGRGAPTAVADMYYQAVEAYKRGDKHEAARCVGVLAHYYGDINQPFHTAYAGMNYGTLHNEYEMMVDAVSGRPGQNFSLIKSDGYQPVTDIRTKTVSAAYFSRSKYPSLFAGLKASKSVTQPAVKSVTWQVLNRASNDLADIIRTIPTGAGLAAAPKTITATMYKYYPAQNSGVCVYAKCLNALGNPIDGAVVDITIPLKAGSKTYRTYTDSKGIATQWVTIDAMRLMTKATVTVVSKSATSIASVTAPVATSASTWFMPTPVLADGSTGIKTSVSNFSPKRYTVVTASTVIHDKAGRPVVGLPIRFSWKFKTSTVYYSAVTNSSGIARVSRNIGGVTAGYRVYVKAQTMSGGINRSSTATFIPK